MTFFCQMRTKSPWKFDFTLVLGWNATHLIFCTCIRWKRWLWPWWHWSRGRSWWCSEAPSLRNIRSLALLKVMQSVSLMVFNNWFTVGRFIAGQLRSIPRQVGMRVIDLRDVQRRAEDEQRLILKTNSRQPSKQNMLRHETHVTYDEAWLLYQKINTNIISIYSFSVIYSFSLGVFNLLDPTHPKNHHPHSYFHV